MQQYMHALYIYKFAIHLPVWPASPPVLEVRMSIEGSVHMVASYTLSDRVIILKTS